MTPEFHDDGHGNTMIRTDIKGAAEIVRGLAGPKRPRLTEEQKDALLNEALGPEFRAWLKRRY